jgi:hypothetical protein
LGLIGSPETSVSNLTLHNNPEDGTIQGFYVVLSCIMFYIGVGFYNREGKCLLRGTK